MTTALLKISCGPMATRHKSHGLSKTDPLLASWILEWNHGGVFATGSIIFPETFVDMIPGSFMMEWMVRPCRAYTPLETDPVQIESLLPEEPCRIVLFDPDGKFDVHMNIKGIPAPTTITVPNIGTGTGSVWYPDCKAKHTGLGIWTVEPLVAEGEINFP